MDKITQSNAISAEQSANASEELSVQAASVCGTVQQLLEVLGGRIDRGSEAGSSVSESTTGSCTIPVPELTPKNKR